MWWALIAIQKLSLYYGTSEDDKKVKQGVEANKKLYPFYLTFFPLFGDVSPRLVVW